MNWFEKMFLKISFGELVKDYGQFSDDQVFSTRQKLSLLKFRKNADEYYVLRAVQQFPSTKLLGFEVNYFKMGKKGMASLSELINVEKII